MDLTTRLGLQKPDSDPVTGDDVDIDVLNANADKIDAVISFTVCTSTARPLAPFAGQAILETDTGAMYVWGGSAWLPLPVQNTIVRFDRIGLGVDADANVLRKLTLFSGGTNGALSQVLLRQSGSASGSRALSTMGGGDTQDRFWLDFDGKMQWAPAGAGGDVVLYRGGSNTLQTDDWLRSVRPAATDWAFGAAINGELQPRYLVKNGGEINWGDGVSSPDTVLYRSGPAVLRTATIEIRTVVSGGARQMDFNHGYGIFADNAGAGSNATRLWFDTPGGGEVVIGPRSGSVFLDRFRVRTGQTTASAANVFMDASGYVMKSTSSERYKVNIRPEVFEREAILALTPVRFQDRREHTEKGAAAREHVGLIAEEVDAIGLKEYVNYDEDGRPDGVQYERLTVALLDIVKDLADRVKRLEER